MYDNEDNIYERLKGGSVGVNLKLVSVSEFDWM